jgi:hypothetical protein
MNSLLNERQQEMAYVDPTLQQNIDAFCMQLDQLIPAHFGRYVVFANAHLFKVCDSLQSAMSVGYTNFGTEPFLVQRVEPLRSHIDFQATCQV